MTLNRPSKRFFFETYFFEKASLIFRTFPPFFT